MKTKLFAILSSVLMICGLTTVYAIHQGGNAANAPGAAQAIENCNAVINAQNAGGLTGAAVGNPNDNHTIDTAVTNCDHFWTN